MIANYFKIAYRILLKHKAYAATNIIGLGVGLAATILIISYIEFEYSFDNFHRLGADIYRVSIKDIKEGKVESDSPVFTPPIGPAMMKDFPEVENYVRLSTPRVAYLSNGDKTLRITDVMHADSAFFDLFSFPLTAGDTHRALDEPYAIVLSEETAGSLFGNDNPMGKLVRINGEENYRVTGIAKRPPGNSHIRFNALLSFSSLYRNPSLFLDWDGGQQYITYVKFRSHANPSDLASKFPGFMWGNINRKLAPVGVRLEPYLQPLREIHLTYSPDSDSTRQNIRIFSMVALFVLFIACVNFINLTTARAVRRANEVGIRKVLGANRPMLVRQFLSESVLIVFFASLVAIFLVEIASPLYMPLLSEEAGLWNFLEMKTMLGVGALVLIVGVVAGSYPAFYLSSLQAAKALKGSASIPVTGGRLKNILIIVQFGMSIALIVCTIMVGRQLAYLKSADPGFNKESIVVLPLVGDEARSKWDLLKKEVVRLPGVIGASASSEIPMDGFTSNGYFPEGMKVPMMISVVDVDDDFLTTFGLTMTAGRSFSPRFPTDKTAYVINRSLASSLSWQDPVGKTIARNGEHTVIGVVKDFNFASLHSRIEPLIITHDPWRGQFENLSVRINPANIAGSLSALQDVWRALVPSAPFYYWFLDESYGRLYSAEERFEKLFLFFSGLAIWIALMGLLSLVSFATEQRSKEIGIRKILGATIMSITAMFSREFLRWVILANLIAWPAAYWFMNAWLENFAYRIDMGWWPFAVASGATLVLGWAVINIQTLRAALANPVDALRYE